MGTDSQSPGKVNWRGWLTAGSLGAVVGSAAVNVFSNDFGNRGLVIAVIVASVLSTGSWVRQFPARSPLVRYSVRILLILAAAVAVLTLFLPVRWTVMATLIAAALVAGAVLIPTDLVIAVQMLAGAASIGIGLALSPGGITLLHQGHVLGGVATLGGAAALGGNGLAALRGSWGPAGLALAGGGVGLAVLGVEVVRAGQSVLGISLICLGAATTAAIVIVRYRRMTLLGVVVVGGGLALAVSGVVRVADDPAFGAAGIAFGIGIIGGGIAVLRDSSTLLGIAFIGEAVASAGVGLAGFLTHDMLFGMAYVGVAVVLVGCGLIILHDDGALGRFRARLAALTREPPDTPP